jgi:hypothetical protein
MVTSTKARAAIYARHLSDAPSRADSGHVAA